MLKKLGFAPRETFEQMLNWGVMPTFDLIINQGNKGVIIVKRRISPYNKTWALPGLRQYKGESYKETLERIAKQELGLEIDPSSAQIIGQYDGFFLTECKRQDLSTGYLIQISKNQKVTLNREHFSGMRYITSQEEIPKKTGAMYRFYLTKYFNKS
jgi:8-oxo-dGTP pyrophosphatase MutT (NUDIX family)